MAEVAADEGTCCLDGRSETCSQNLLAKAQMLRSQQHIWLQAGRVLACMHWPWHVDKVGLLSTQGVQQCIQTKASWPGAAGQQSRLYRLLLPTWHGLCHRASSRASRGHSNGPQHWWVAHRQRCLQTGEKLLFKGSTVSLMLSICPSAHHFNSMKLLR